MFKKKKDQIYQSYWSISWNIFKKNKVAMVCLFIVILLCLIALFAPLIAPYDPNKQVLTDRLMKPCGQHWFGTDDLGRDIFSRIIYGCRVSLSVGIISQIIATVIGYTMGVCAGYFGGKVDMIMQRIVEILNSIPYLITVTLLLLVMKPGLMSITFALMFSGWLGMSRIARAEVLKLKEQEYVLASRTLGAKSFRIIFKEILPNIFGPLITQTMFSIPHAIFTEAFLAFIGLGVPEPMASLGSLISSGYQNFTSHPYMIVFPLIVMGLLMLCFNMLADGLRDALDPKMKDM